MNPFKLTGTAPSGKMGSVWACGACMRTCVDEGHAIRCCDPKCPECGEPVTGQYTRLCGPCGVKHEAKRDAERFRKAKKVYVDDYARDDVIFDHDETATDIGEWMEMPDDERPEWAWATVEVKSVRLDAIHVLENILEEHHDGAINDLDVPALQKALDEWSDKQDLGWWVQSYSTVVVLDKKLMEEQG